MTVAEVGTRFGATGWTRLLLLCTALLFEGMSLSSINVQAAPIRRDLYLSSEQLQLVVGAFLAGYAGLLLFGGRCADRWGSRRLFRIGVLVFGVASLAAALAGDAPALIAARILQGAGAALTAPAAVALIVHSFAAGSARNRALGALSAMGAVGFSLGVVVGGALTHLFGWRAGFAVHVPLAVAVVLLSLWYLPDTPRLAGTMPWAAALGLTGGLVLLVAGTGAVGSSPVVGIPLAASGLLVGVVALTRSAGGPCPLVPLGLLRRRGLAAAGVALGGTFAGISGAMLVIGAGLQDQRGYSAAAVGLAFLPQGVAVGVLSPLAARAMSHLSPMPVLRVGLVAAVAGHLLYLTAFAPWGGWSLFSACLLVGGGVAAAYPAATLLACTAAGAAQQATASGLVTTCQQAGSAIGVAVVSAVQAAGGITAGLSAAATIMILTAVVTAALRPSTPLSNTFGRL